MIKKMCGFIPGKNSSRKRFTKINISGKEIILKGSLNENIQKTEIRKEIPDELIQNNRSSRLNSSL